MKVDKNNHLIKNKEDNINLYYKDYVSKKRTLKEISLLCGASEGYTKIVFNRHIISFRGKRAEVGELDINIQNLKKIDFTNCEAFRLNDFTIGDWGIMTDKQKEEYLITELNY